LKTLNRTPAFAGEMNIERVLFLPAKLAFDGGHFQKTKFLNRARHL
jgi:hypothetical protein